MAAPRRTNAPLRIALLAVKCAAPSETPVDIETTLRDSLDRDTRISRLDDSMVRAALKGFGYEWSTNMTTAEARRLGAAIGCDYLILGKVELLARSAAAGESHEEAYVALFFVDARTGKLQLFDFAQQKTDTKEAAIGGLKRAIEARVASYVDQLLNARLSKPIANQAPAMGEPVESIPEEGSARAEGFAPPQFLNRVKPEYTAQADLADVTATVEASVVFKSSGEIGMV